MSIETEINRFDARPFRRVFIKRRSNTTGLYESSWQDITKYVKKWGTIDRSVDDLRLNRFVHSGFNFTVRNDTGAFNTEESPNSLWFGFMTRYRTLIKVEAGYFEAAQTELPTDSSLGVFILSDEIPISGVTNSASIRAKSLVSVFDEVRASDVAGIGPTQTASELIARIRDHTDGSGNFYFRQFITSTSWTIQTTTSYYNLATSTSVGSMTCWDFMEKLAEAEGNILLINRSGGLEFRDRAERTSTSQFPFQGLGYHEQNVIQLVEAKEAYNKLFTFFRMKYLEADTSTSYVTAGSTSAVDPSSTAWKYGARIYNFETPFVNNTATAQTLVTNLANTFSALKEEVKIKAKFVPQLEISDKVTLSYRSYDLASTLRWDQFYWDVDTWPLEVGENFDWDQVGFKVLSISHDLDNLSSTFHLRKI